MAIPEKLHTAEELWALSQRPEYADKRLVLIDGVIHEIAPAKWLHSDIASELDMAIRLYVKRHNLGRVTAAETGYTLGPGTTLTPDVGFVAAARVPQEPPDGYVPFAPDLAVEVVSPGNGAVEISTKVQKYIQHGTRLIWIVYPERKRVDVYSPAEHGVTVTFIDIDGVLEGGDVLPGFKLPVRDLFTWGREAPDRE